MPTSAPERRTGACCRGTGCKEPHRCRGRSDLAEEDRQVSFRGVIRLRMTSTLYDPCLGTQTDFSR
jgi:hypothetical protein